MVERGPSVPQVQPRVWKSSPFEMELRSWLRCCRLSNADTSILERVVRDQVEQHKARYLLRTWPPSLTSTYFMGWEEHLSWVVCFDVPMMRELLALVDSQMKALEFRGNRGLIRSRRGLLERTLSLSDTQSITKSFAWIHE